MLLLKGTVKNLFERPEYVNRKTGEVREARYVVQVEHSIPIRTGGRRFKIEEFYVDAKDRKTFEAKQGQDVELPVRPYAVEGSTEVRLSLLASDA